MAAGQKAEGARYRISYLIAKGKPKKLQNFSKGPTQAIAKVVKSYKELYNKIEVVKSCIRS